MEEEGGASNSWMNSCLANFSHYLGMPTEDLEGGDFEASLKRMKGRKEQKEKVTSRRRKFQKSSRFEKELKILAR